MNFEVIVSKGNPRVYKNRDLSLIDVDDEKIAIAHQNYNRDIYFNEILNIEKKRGIKITLENQEVFTLSFKWTYYPGLRGVQEAKNAGRKGDILYNLLRKKMEME